MTVLAITRLNRDLHTKVKIEKLVEDLFLRKKGDVSPLFLEVTIMVDPSSSESIHGLRIYFPNEINDVKEATNFFIEERFNNYFYGKGRWRLPKEDVRILEMRTHSQEEKWIRYHLPEIKNVERNDTDENIVYYDIFFKEKIEPGKRAAFRMELHFPRFAKYKGILIRKKLFVETRFYDRHFAEQYGIDIIDEELIPIEELYVWLVVPWKWRIIPESIAPHDSSIFRIRTLEESNPYNEKGGFERKVLRWCWNKGLNKWESEFCASVDLEWEAPSWIIFSLGIVIGAFESIILRMFESQIRNLFNTIIRIFLP